MDDERNAKIDFVEQTLGFYFEGGFREVVVAHELVEEIDNWFQLAKLFDASIPDPDKYSAEEKNEAFALIEDIWAEVKAAHFVGETPDFDDVGSGYEIELRKYHDVIERAKTAALSGAH